MLGLVDYEGSDSDGEHEDEPLAKTKSIVNSNGPSESSSKNNLQPGDEDFFMNDTSSRQTIDLKDDDVLEEIVKPKDWELKIADKKRKKMEKRMKKAAKREKKLLKKEKKISKVGNAEKKGKVVISAFGALPSIDYNNSSEDDDDDVAQNAKKAASSKVGMGFLANLPAPKGKNNKTGESIGSVKAFVPLTVSRNVAPVNPTATTAPSIPRFVDDSDDDDEDVPADFFGFSNSNKETDNTVEIPQMPSSSMDVVGPSRPSNEYVHPSQMYNMADVEMEEESDDQFLPNSRTISDEQAHKLLMRFSHDIGPEEKRSINEMAASIIDVKVDDAIGSDVKSNILKNLSHRAFAEATSAPVPQAPAQGGLSRRKHQITYLANLAVAREEQLKDKWAEQKQTKRMARQKYGF